jgi:hypothetical protein
MVREVFLPGFLPAIPMIGLLYFVEQILMPSSLLLTVIVAGSAILVYLAGYIGLGASKSERETCRNFALSTARLLRGWISRP